MATGRSVRTVLAAVADATAGGQVAARKAVELAWLFGADVVLYHACYDPALSGGAFFDSVQMAEVFDRIMFYEREQVRYHYVLIDYACTAIGGHGWRTARISTTWCWPIRTTWGRTG